MSLEIVRHVRSRSREDEKKDFLRFALANNDLRSALYTCDYFIALITNQNLKTVPLELSQAFIPAIILSYCRPFSGGSIGELPGKWTKFADETLRKTHHEMVSWRHNHYAHSDPNVHSVSIIPDGFLPKEIGTKPPQIAYTINDAFPPAESVFRYRAVIADLQPRIEEEVYRLLNHLYAGLELPKGVFKLKFNEGL